jgi:phytoene dehydrogenase-like protein
MAGTACARTLLQAGHRVTVFEKSAGLGGRMATRQSAFGSFDHGAQYFTVRDPRFALALKNATQICRPGAPTPCVCWMNSVVLPLRACPRASPTGCPRPV